MPDIDTRPQISLVRGRKRWPRTTAFFVLTMMLLFFLPLTAQAQDITTGLVGHWTLDEESGTTAGDSSGNAQDGSLVNMNPPDDWGSGKISGGLSFDGIDDYVDVTADNNFCPSNLTVSVWIKRSDTETAGTVVGKAGSFDFGLRNGRTVIHAFGSQDKGWTFSDTEGSVVDSSWNHLVLRYDGTQVELYLNGVIDAVDSTYTGNMACDSGATLQIGSRLLNSIGYYSGTIDDVRIYNRALTADDVAELAATTFPGKLRFNTGHRTLEYYDSTEWVGVNRTGSPTADGLVGHWKLDEESGTTAVDSAGSNNGTMQGGLSAGTDSVSGSVGEALTFDGVGDYVEISNDASLEPSDELTVAAWVYWDDYASGDYQKIFALSKTDTANPYQSYALGQYQSGSDLIFEVNVGGALRVSGTYTVPAKKWVHVVGQWKTGEAVKLFVDGALVNQSGSTYSGSIVYYTMPANIGRGSNAQADTQWSGSIDDVRVYDRALSAVEIQNLYEYTRASGFNEKAGLVGHWKLDETSGTVAADTTGNNNDGTMQGGLDAGTDSVAGQVDTSLEFNGTSDYIEVPRNDVLERPTDAITLSAWVFWDSHLSGLKQRVISKSKDDATAPWQSYSLTQYDNNRRHRMELAIDGALKTTTNPLMDLGEWIHVVGTWKSGDYMRLYYNGEEVATSASAETGTITYYDTPLAIGQSSIGEADSQWDGKIDDVRIYDRALSAEEVNALYHWGAYGGAQCANPAGDPGKIIYNATHDVMQYCDGFDWVAMGPVPGAGGASCSSPSGSTGALIYNASENVLQYCDGTNWRGVTQRDCPHIGDECSDGSFYIGDSPADGKRVYMTSSAHETTTTWHEDPPCYRCGDGNIANSNSDGRANVEALRAYDGETATAGTLDGFGAAKYCDNLNDVHGHSDWYLPAGGGSSSTEIYLIWKMLQAAGNVAGLDTSGNWYWSSTENNADSARRIKFDTGSQINSGSKENSQVIRCVRR